MFKNWVHVLDCYKESGLLRGKGRSQCLLHESNES